MKVEHVRPPRAQTERPADVGSFERVFNHLPEYRIIVCKRCAFAVVPAQVKRHLHDQHPDLSGELRKSIVATSRELSSVTHALDEVQYPDLAASPVDLLPIYNDELRFTAVDDDGVQCSYVCREERLCRGARMTGHIPRTDTLR